VLALGLAGCRDRRAAAPVAAPEHGLSPTSPASAAPVTGVVSTAAAAGAPAACPAPPPARETVHGILLHAAAATNIQPPFVLAAYPSAAAGVGVAVPPGAGTAPGVLCLPYVVQKAGPYTIWIRALWGTDGEDACSNSVYVQPDGAPRVLVQDATYRAWHWVRARFPAAREGWVQLAAGAHDLRLESREDGILIDQIYIIPWHPSEMECYVPQDIEE
jgi:hypothetical protein